MRRGAVALVLSVVAFAAAIVSTAGAHPDQGTKAIFTSVTINDVCITQAIESAKTWSWGCESTFRGRYPGRTFGQFNRVRPRTPSDGMDQNAEFVLTILLNHDDHTILQITKFENDAMTSNPWTINEQFYDHDECEPVQQVSIYPLLVELDTGTGADILSGITSALASAAAGGGLPGFAAGGVVKGAAWLNGNDHYGGDLSGTPAFIPLPPNGQPEINLQGQDGAARLRFETFTGDSANIVCALEPSPSPSPSPSTAPPTPQEQGAFIYEPLRESYALATEVFPENGNPVGLTRGQLSQVQGTWLGYIGGLGGTVAGLEIDAARGLVGTDTAIEWFQTGQQQRMEGDVGSALTSFENAFVEALTARLDPVSSDQPNELPFQVILMPGTFATEIGGQATTLATVLGGGAIVGDSLSAGTDLEVEMVPSSTGPRMYQIDATVLRGAGAHDVLFEVTDAQDQVASSTFTVRARRLPNLTCSGERANIVGTADDRNLDGTRRDEVIVGGNSGEIVRGGGGDDLVCSGRGRDALLGGGGSDVLFAGPDDDQLAGGRGKDACDGGNGLDTILVGGTGACERYR